MSSTVSFYIHPKFLKAMALFASRDETRYTLNGICVELRAKRVLLIATDGRRLAAINVTEDMEWTSEEEELDFLIPNTLLRALPKPGSTMSGRLHVSYNQETRVVTISGNRSVSAQCEEDWKYPNWRTTVPAQLPATTPPYLSVNGSLLCDFGSACQTMLGSSYLLLRQADPLGPIAIHSNYSKDTFFGLIMPVRGETDHTIPEWAKT